jgi:hypothetical protein
VTVTERQAEKLGYPKNCRFSPFVEKCCLRLVANESFSRAAEDIEMMTGVKVSASSQHRLVEKTRFESVEIEGKIEALSLDGGKVRVRTPNGHASEWKDYKAISLHGQATAAFYQENEKLIGWVNALSRERVITCVGDGHDGIWNLIERIGESYERREVLDWYHLSENLYRMGGSLKVLKRVENYLWQGQIDEGLGEISQWSGKEAHNFRAYVQKHRSRIPDYSLYQELGICIGSGSVESAIKQIGNRMKIVGAQWKADNIPRYLNLRCAYLNGDIR